MKKNGMIALLGIAMMGVLACKDGESAKNTVKEETVISEESSDTMGSEQMSPEKGVKMKGVIQDYMALKDALVASDQKKAGAAASAIVSSLSALLASSESINQSNMKSILENTATKAQLIVQGDLAQQRIQFKSLNEDISGILAITGSSVTLYEQYCPMFDNNQGGTWLSMEEEIMNPYFGDQMLHCGKVTRIISQ